MDPIAWVVVVAVVAIVAQFGTTLLLSTRNYDKKNKTNLSSGGARPPKRIDKGSSQAEYVDIDSVKTNLNIPEVKSGNLNVEETEVKTSKEALNKLKELRGK